MIYWIALWIVIVGGLVPAAYFTWSWRPRFRWSPTQLDAGGWVQVVLALYLLAAARTALGHYQQPDHPLESVATIAVGLGIDAALWLRVGRWLVFRRQGPDHPMRRCTDPQDG